MRIAVVLPVFNEEKKISDVLDNLSKLKLPIILVDDGSKDKTLDMVIKRIKSKKITLISHGINLGKGAALRTGGEAAFKRGFEAVIFMDADGQHNPLDLQKFVKKLNTGKYDVVLGSRNLHHGVPLVRFLGNKFASVLISLLFGLYVSDILSGFRAVTKEAFRKLKLQSKGYGVETEMIVKMSKYKLSYSEVPVETIYFDKNKGVTILDALGILFDVCRWRVNL